VKILIIGSGAIGSFIGGVLGHSGREVVFYDLPDVIERIKSTGVIVDGLGERMRIESPTAVSRIDKDDMFDLAVVSVKSYSTGAAVKDIPENAVKKVLTFQNGVENEEILAEKFGKYKIIAGTITYPVAVLGPGHIKIENLKGGLGFAPMDPTVDMEGIPEMFETSGLDTAIYEDYRGMKWSKLMLNIVCNATCAILGMTPGEIFSDRRLVWIERESILELLRVVRKKKIPLYDLPGYPVKMMKTVYSLLPPSLLKMLLRKRIAKSRGDKKPSLMIEMERGSKRTEVRMYNGAISRAAEKMGIKAPVNRILSETLDGITSGSIPAEEYKGKPGVLYKKVRK